MLIRPPFEATLTAAAGSPRGLGSYRDRNRITALTHRPTTKNASVVRDAQFVEAADPFFLASDLRRHGLDDRGFVTRCLVHVAHVRRA